MEKRSNIGREAAVNALVHACSKNGDFRGMVKAARMRDRSLTVSEIKIFLKNPPRRTELYVGELLEYSTKAGVLGKVEPALMCVFVKRGDVRRAKILAKIRKRKLSQDEIDDLLMGALKSTARDDSVYDTVKLKPSQKSLDGFIRAATRTDTKGEQIYKKELEELFAVAKKGASKRAKEQLVRFCLETQSFFYFFDAVEIAGRKETQKEVDRLIAVYVERNSYSDAARFAEELKASPRTINRLLLACVERGDLSSGARVAILGASKKNLETFLKACVQEGDTSGISTVLSILKRNIAREEANELISVCIKKGFSVDLTEAFVIAGREPTTQEKRRLLKNALEHGWIDDAKHAATLLSKELNAQEILRLKRGYLKVQSKK